MKYIVFLHGERLGISRIFAMESFTGSIHWNQYVIEVKVICWYLMTQNQVTRLF